ncbi:MAG: DNRLRE domain-containing protein [Patescibacteria group bacterium]
MTEQGVTSSIPFNPAILSPRLNLKESGTYGTPRTIAVHSITQKWTEQGVTWGTIANDFIPQPTATTTLSWDGILGWNSWDVTNDVVQMTNNTFPNYGWMMKDTVEDRSQRYWFFHSRESGSAPELRVMVKKL